MTKEIIIVADAGSVAHEAARRFTDLAREAIDSRGRFSVALSGGSTPGALFTLLAEAPYRERIPWAEVHLFWGDERWVPADDPESNFSLARETILNEVDLPRENIHPVPTDSETAEEGAVRYEQALRTFFASPGDTGDFSTFDLVHLGVGEDGHTASLFPDDPALLEAERWVLPVTTPPWRPPRERVTFTLPLINSARTVLFTASGSAKREVVRSIVLDQTGGEKRYPAGMVKATEDLVWYVDEEASTRSRPSRPNSG